MCVCVCVCVCVCAYRHKAHGAARAIAPGNQNGVAPRRQPSAAVGGGRGLDRCHLVAVEVEDMRVGIGIEEGYTVLAAVLHPVCVEEDTCVWRRIHAMLSSAC